MALDEFGHEIMFQGPEEGVDGHLPRIIVTHQHREGFGGGVGGSALLNALDEHRTRTTCDIRKNEDRTAMTVQRKVVVLIILRNTDDYEE